MNSLDTLVLGRHYNLFYASETLSHLKRPKDNALVAQYLGVEEVCNEAVLYVFSVGEKKLLVWDIEYYRVGSEDISVNRLEST